MRYRQRKSISLSYHSTHHNLPPTSPIQSHPIPSYHSVYHTLLHARALRHYRWRKSSVLAIIQHILLFHPRLLYKAIRLLTFISYIIPFFLNLLYQAFTSPSNFRSPTHLPGPNQTSPTPRNTPQPQKAALPPTTKPYLRSHAQAHLSNLPMNSMISTTQPRKSNAAGSLINHQGTSSVHGMCLRGGRGIRDHLVWILPDWESWG